MTLRVTQMTAKLALMERRAMYFNGHLYFQKSIIQQPSWMTSNGGLLPLDQLDDPGIERPRGRFNQIELMDDIIQLLHYNAEDYLHQSEKLNQFAPNSDVFWADDPYPPFPQSQRMAMVSRVTGQTADVWARLMQDGKMNHSLLDNRIINLIDPQPDKGFVRVWFTNHDPIMNEGLGIPKAIDISMKQWIYRAGRRVFFTTREDARAAIDHSW